jgi:diguanylate cyclase
MFFRKLGLDRSAAKAAPSAPASPEPTDTPSGSGAHSDTPDQGAAAPKRSPEPSGAGDSADDVGLVLDTLGGVLTAYARSTFDLPDRPSEESRTELLAWQRHATLGIPVEASEEGGALGFNERDWGGVARSFTSHRRDESAYVETAVSELRDALWAVVETVHNAVKVEQKADDVADSQVTRARSAIARLQTGQIKQEVLGALTAIEDAFRTRQEAMQQQYSALAGKIENLGVELEEAKKESTTDALTGLGNRKLFDAMATRALHMNALSRQPVVLVIVDLDKFKLVNDMYGHQAGDQTLINVAKCLSKVFLRQSDVVCRYGGDEYAIVLNNTDMKVGEMLAERLVRAICDMPSPHASMEFAVGASVGLAEYNGSESLEEWISRADKAMYTAKQMSGDRIALAEAA